MLQRRLLVLSCALLSSCGVSTTTTVGQREPVKPVTVFALPKDEAVTPPNVSLQSPFISPYDQFPVEFSLEKPKVHTERAPLVVFLDSKLRTVPENAWALSIPSRPLMNYQLLAEGDFWRLLQEVHEAYPELQQAPTYLVASGEASDAALLFANHSPYFFSGVAFSSSRLGFDLPNLDLIPLVHYSLEDEEQSTPWGGRRLVERLSKRERAHAQHIEGSYLDALHLLISETPEERAEWGELVIEETSHSQILPWLKLVERKSEHDPVTVKVRAEDYELWVDAPNIKSLDILPLDRLGYPLECRTLRLNHRRFALPTASTNQWMRFSEDPEEAHGFTKADRPSGLINFYRQEPLLVVYQDEGVDTEYRSKAQSLAQRFAHCEFAGFPALNANIPLIPLSQYKAETYGPHRLILVGKYKDTKEILEETKGYLPLPTGIKFHPQTAFGLIYPPESPSSTITLSLMLAAQDAQGLDVLEKHYTSATSLFDKADMRLWSAVEGYYTEQESKMWGSHWGSTEPSRLLLVTPQQNRVVWESYIQELLLEEAEVARIAITQPLKHAPQLSPRLTHAALSQTFPQTSFAKVKLRGRIGEKLGSRLFERLESPLLYRMQDFLTERGSSYTLELKELRSEGIEVLVDASVLENLNPIELSMLEYELLPYNLREMLLYKITQNREEFGREFLRLANLMEES